MSKLVELFAFVTMDQQGNESIIVGDYGKPIGMLPLFCDNITRVKSLQLFADVMSQGKGEQYRILKFQLVGELDKESLCLK